MRQFILALVAFVSCVPSIFAQIPPRLQALAKNGPFRLTRVLGTPEMQASFAPTSAFSADGKFAVYAEDLTTGTTDKPLFRTRLIVWNRQSPGYPREFEIAGKSVTALALSADGGKVLLAGQTLPEKAKAPRSYLALWDLQMGKEIKHVPAGDSQILAVALSSGETVALTAGLGSLKSWDLAKGRELAVYARTNLTSVMAVAFLPGDKQFLAAHEFGVVRLWDVANPKPVRTYGEKRKLDFTLWLTVSQDGKRFIAGHFQSSLTLWDIAGKAVGTLKMPSAAADEMLLGAALPGDGKTVLAVWGKSNPAADDVAPATLLAWDAAAKKTLWSHKVSYHGRLPILVRGDKLLIGGGPNVLDVWNWKDGKLLESSGGHKSSVNAVAVLANGDILSADQQGMRITWRDGKLLKKEHAHAGAITALATSKDRTRWLSAGPEFVVRQGPMTANSAKLFSKKHTAAITSLAYSSDAKIAFSASADRTARSWDAMSGQEIAVFAGHSEGLNAVAVSPDGRWLATGSDDTTIRVWPIKEGKRDLDREEIVLEDHKKAVLCLAFSPDGKTLLSGSQDQTLKVWDWQNAKVKRTIKGHKNWITSVTFIDAGSVLSVSDDLSLRRWDLATGKESARIDFGVVGDCPRCLALVGDRLIVGTASWLVFDFQLSPSAKSAN